MKLLQRIFCKYCSWKLACLGGPTCIQQELFSYKKNGWLEKFWMWLAFHLPKQLIYFASIRLIAFATTGKYSDTVVPELNAVEALRRFENGRRS